MVQIILRMPRIQEIRGRSRSSHLRDIKQGLYTTPVRLGPQAVGWPESEVAALNSAVIAGKSEAEIRELVKSLHAKRLTAV